MKFTIETVRFQLRISSNRAEDIRGLLEPNVLTYMAPEKCLKTGLLNQGNLLSNALVNTMYLARLFLIVKTLFSFVALIF